MNRFVIADPKRCVACFACVAGCVEIHRKVGLQAFPRLYLTYTKSGTMPIQCRHCEEPNCAAVCPVHAISRKDRAIQINESLCIGCKLCALACPFGVIVAGGSPIPQLEFNIGHYNYVNTPFQNEPMTLRELGFDERLSLLNWETGRKTVAVKCDLCYFSEADPACIIACPHKALRIVDDEAGDEPDLVEGMKAVSVVVLPEFWQDQ
jgi:hydrogenase-4 component A